MTDQEIGRIVQDIEYKPDGLLFIGKDDERTFIQYSEWVLNFETGKKELMKGRKWLLSPHMVEGEVVQTVFLAIEVWETHERRERFKYRGQKIFSPHLNVAEIALMMKSNLLNEKTRA